MGFIKIEEPVPKQISEKSSPAQNLLLKLKDLRNETPERLRNLRAILHRLEEQGNLAPRELEAIRISLERIDKAERFLERRGKWLLGPSLKELQDEKASMREFSRWRRARYPRGALSSLRTL